MWLKYRHTFAEGNNDWKYMDTLQTDSALAAVAAAAMVVGLEEEYAVCGSYRGVECALVDSPPEVEVPCAQ